MVKLSNIVKTTNPIWGANFNHTLALFYNRKHKDTRVIIL